MKPTYNELKEIVKDLLDGGAWFDIKKNNKLPEERCKQIYDIYHRLIVEDMKFRFISDPGHAWLEVPQKILIDMDLACEISSFSYFNGSMAYLEEDMDAGIFVHKFEEIYGVKPKLVEVYEEHTQIRNYVHYDLRHHFYK